jgi:hypothetical protein
MKLIQVDVVGLKALETFLDCPLDMLSTTVYFPILFVSYLCCNNRFIPPSSKGGA